MDYFKNKFNDQHEVTMNINEANLMIEQLQKAIAKAEKLDAASATFHCIDYSGNHGNESALKLYVIKK